MALFLIPAHLRRVLLQCLLCLAGVAALELVLCAFGLPDTSAWGHAVLALSVAAIIWGLPLFTGRH